MKEFRTENMTGYNDSYSFTINDLQARLVHDVDNKICEVWNISKEEVKRAIETNKILQEENTKLRTENIELKDKLNKITNYINEDEE